MMNNRQSRPGAGESTCAGSAPAVNAGWHFLWFTVDHARHVERNGGRHMHEMDRENLNAVYLDYLCRNAREIFSDLTRGRPVDHLLMGLDLTRTKEEILTEIGDFAARLQERPALGAGTPQKPLQWLPVLDDILQVWDLWEHHGQRCSLPRIARDLGISRSTVRERWRLAYRHIHGKEFDGRRIRGAAGEEAARLCTRCTEQAECRKVGRGSPGFLPCPAYLRLAETERAWE